MASSAQRKGIRGVSRLRKKLRKMPDEIVADVRLAIADSAEIVKLEQLRRVPVAEGDLARSIEVKLGGDKLSAEIGPGARTKRARDDAGWRSHFTEFGTRPHGGHPGTRPQPFIFPGFEAAKPQIRKIIDTAVDKALRDVVAMGGSND